MRHLLSIEDLERSDIERICDRARSFTEVSEREVFQSLEQQRLSQSQPCGYAACVDDVRQV